MYTNEFDHCGINSCHENEIAIGHVFYVESIILLMFVIHTSIMSIENILQVNVLRNQVVSFLV
jgi:hypothetical protein